MFICCRPLAMPDREDTGVGSRYNPIVLSDDEIDGNYESDSDSYTSLEFIMRNVLRADMLDSDEILHEFGHAKGQTKRDIYRAVMRTGRLILSQKRTGLNLRSYEGRRDVSDKSTIILRTLMILKMRFSLQNCSRNQRFSP